MSDPSETGGYGPRILKIPDGDSRERLVCPDCGFINYENPKIVVGAVIAYEGDILMCRRDIEPRRGYWTIPAGYLELNETVIDGARREAREEALAEIEIDRVLGIYNVPRISQVQIIYRATLARPEFGAGEETQEAVLFPWNDIPRGDIAFPSVHWALDHFKAVEGKIDFAPHANPQGDLGNFKI
ncbi:MAG: NUDIX hydrolase [Pseudomonadota bacterium]|nr:NUDIX hydrolase [Pseudomonadota bacterium]